MNKNCEECLALNLLLSNGLIGEDSYISDKPDIINGDEGIEVTSAIDGEINNRINFGKLPKDNEYINTNDYNCNTCEFLQLCKDEHEYDYCVYCKKCENNNFWLRDGFVIIAKGNMFYKGNEHPRAIGWTDDFYGFEEDLKKAIERKERKSKNYKQQKLSLFLYYDKEINKIEKIESKIFKNIYIYCIDSGRLYKNWEVIKTYSSITPKCYNKNCNEFGKF